MLIWRSIVCDCVNPDVGTRKRRCTICDIASDEEVPAPVVASIGTVMLAWDAMSQMVQRLFLVPTSGFTQSQTMLRQINTYLSTQWLAISSMGALRNGPHGSIDKWAATELLPKTYWG